MLAETQEPLPLAPTQTPQWTKELTPANIERYIDVAVQCCASLPSRKLVRSASTRICASDCWQLGLLPPAIREDPIMAQMIADAERQ